ncbi:hypothetical protein WJX73_007936 [Symbiochloris irregularis]|uniref:Uncharacterized protein n=1 Tax=Symbiochloris irregularis TaxID=706552 RepID=A0AAW1PXQ1_9CHLO
MSPSRCSGFVLTLFKAGPLRQSEGEEGSDAVRLLLKEALHPDVFALITDAHCRSLAEDGYTTRTLLQGIGVDDLDLGVFSKALRRHIVNAFSPAFKTYKPPKGPFQGNLGSFGFSNFQAGTDCHTFQHQDEQEQYFDPEQVLHQLSKFFDRQIRNEFGSAHGKWAARPHAGVPAGPMFINGPIKSGKTFTYDLVLAMLQQHPILGLNREGEVAILEINVPSVLGRSTSLEAIINKLLGHILDWAQQFNVPVEASKWQNAVHAFYTPGLVSAYSAPHPALVELLNGIQHPTIVLWDEAQVLFSPCTKDDVTKYSKEHMLACLDILRPRFPDICEDVLEYVPPTPACLTDFLSQHPEHTSLDDAKRLLAQWDRDKLMAESIADWSGATQLLVPEQAQGLRELAFPNTGVRAAKIPAGISNYLGPYCLQNRKNCLYLEAPRLRSCLMRTILEDGSIARQWQIEGESDHVRVLSEQALQRLGESLNRLAKQGSNQTTPGAQELFTWVEELAADMAKAMPHPQWPDTVWWQRVERADKTSLDGPKFRDAWDRSNKGMSAGSLLQWLLRLMRHIIAHSSASPEKPLRQTTSGSSFISPLDYPLTSIIPNVLGSSPTDCLYRLQTGLACQPDQPVGHS